ncbi:MAG: hybrid sensor histidine kinase/response regulator [Acidobacteriota bacterium]|nr:hybrid sensor histidine kinase/response regulator [Acidobacteriota bacterium]
MPLNAHILYIEDNEFNQRLVKKILEPQGFTISQAHDGIKGIKRATDLHPDLILMDLDLPYLDGLGAAAKIKSVPELKEIPIVALTAKSSSRDRDKALVAGCDGYIEKPIDASTFADSIRKYLEGKRETSDPKAKDQILKDFNVDLIDQLGNKVEELEHTNRELTANKEALQNAYQQSQDWNLELQRLTRLKENIVTITSHELRTPLSISKGYIELLLEGMIGDINEDQQRLLQIAYSKLQQMRELIDKITDLNRLHKTRRSPLNLVKVDLNHAFIKVYATLTYFMQIRNLTLVNELNDEPVYVLADKNMLDQIFTNLLKNAICFTPDKGRITVRTHQDGEKAYFQIEDNGIGLKQEDLTLIFDEFYQVCDVNHHKSGNFEFMTRGIGVGLALCQRILNELGGKIWADSSGLQQGSTFTFYLPMVKIE